MTHLRTATVDRSGWISALHTSVASNRIVPALYGVASALDAPVVTRTSSFDGASSDAVSVTGCDASRTVTVATVVTTVPTVVHTEVLSVRGVEVFAVAVIIAVSAYSVPGVVATISVIEMRTSEVEVVTVRVTGVNAEVPVAGVPVQRTIEIGCCEEGIPLPVKQDIAQVEVTALPVGTIYVVIAGDTHQVVEVNLVGSLILLVRQVQLVSHLVRQEECLVTCLFVTHGMGRNRHCQHCYQGYHYLLHNCKVLIVRHYFLVSGAK